MKIINRYLISEFFPKFLTSLLVFTFILLMDRLFDLADLLLNKGVGLLNTIKLFSYILPSLFIFTVPMAILAGTVLLFSRLNEDNEITAIHTAGVTMPSIIKPIIIISLVFSLIMLYFNSTLAPKSNSKFKTFYYEILYKNPIMQFSEKSFVQIQNYDIYIKRISEDNKLNDILIYQWKEGLPTITTAKTAEMAIAEGKGILFRLNNGKILKENLNKIGEFNLCGFSDNEMILGLNQKSDFLSKREGGIRELTSSDLVEKIKTVPENIKHYYRIEYHSRIALAFASFIFVFVAGPISLLYKKRAKSFGITATIAIIFIYYILLVAGTTLGERGFVNPIAGVWLPNLTIGLAGIFFTLKIARH
ncbi:MAG: LptF/LptG family permease [Elusimicrobia bacterium]|nr:LptF/LptG family permease [Elusimicrobiota bacterium]